MSESIILYAIMLFPAVIMWSVPKFRKMNGNWLISLKTVPLGIIAGDFTDMFITWCYRLLCEIRLEHVKSLHFGIRSLLVFGTALLTVIVSGLLINRIFRVKKKYNPFPSLLLFFPALIAYGILSFIISLTTTFSGKYQGDWKYIYLPRENGDGFVFEQQSIHPYLAEYNYRLRFVRDKKVTYQQLFTNYGGRTHFNLYRLKNGRMLFRDKDWDYLVDPAKQQVFRLAPIKDKLYAARIPNEEINSWGFPYEKDGKMMMPMGAHVVPAEEVTGMLEGMVYYGCITDKFYSASERVETEIKKMR